MKPCFKNLAHVAVIALFPLLFSACTVKQFARTRGDSTQPPAELIVGKWDLSNTFTCSIRTTRWPTSIDTKASFIRCPDGTTKYIMWKQRQGQGLNNPYYEFYMRIAATPDTSWDKAIKVKDGTYELIISALYGEERVVYQQVFDVETNFSTPLDML